MHCCANPTQFASWGGPQWRLRCKITVHVGGRSRYSLSGAGFPVLPTWSCIFTATSGRGVRERGDAARSAWWLSSKAASPRCCCGWGYFPAPGTGYLGNCRANLQDSPLSLNSGSSQLCHDTQGETVWREAEPTPRTGTKLGRADRFGTRARELSVASVGPRYE